MSRAWKCEVYRFLCLFEHREKAFQQVNEKQYIRCK